MAITQRDTSETQLHDMRGQLTRVQDSLSRTLDDKRRLAAELEGLRATLTKPIASRDPLPPVELPQSSTLGREYKKTLLREAKLKRADLVEQENEDLRQEVANLRAIVAHFQGHTPQTSDPDPFGVQWAHDVFNAKRDDLDALHDTLFGQPSHPKIGVESLRKKILKHGGWKFSRGKLKRVGA